MSWFAPTKSLLDISTRIDPNEGPFYTDYLNNLLEDYPELGLKSLTPSSQYTILASKFPALAQLFEDYYRFREIGGETVERFQYNVKRRLLEIEDYYNTLFNLYEQEPVTTRGRSIITDTDVDIQEDKDKTSTVDTEYNTSDKETFQDTPISDLTSGEYATNVTLKDNTNTGAMDTTNNESNKTTRKTTQAMNTHDKMASEEITIIMENYKSLSIAFVKEFEPCFINVLGRL